MTEKIRVGISSCLIGEEVRWNGGHKQDRYIKDTLGNYFDWVPVCPEVEVGMGVPRETVALSGAPEAPDMTGTSSGTDWTGRMNRYSRKRVRELESSGLCGFIFKNKSPSCGLQNVPVYKEPGSSTVKRGQGLFARAFASRLPLIPVEEEGRLNDPVLRENFIVRVFSYYRLEQLKKQPIGPGDLVAFHSRNKFLLLAHSRKHYQELGRQVAHLKGQRLSAVLDEYRRVFMEALTVKSTPKKNTDVLMHMMGFLKKLLTPAQKEDLLNTIHDFRNGHIALIVPLTLIRHYAVTCDVPYLKEQVYLNPHPKELGLRSRI